MQKIFISGTGGFGSSRITTLPQPVKEKIGTYLNQQAEIFIGDCQGVDTLVQEYLQEKNYKHVTVYYSGLRYRNKRDAEWKNRSVPSNAYGRAFYTAKDKQACSDADAGLAIWDGESKGTARNIWQLKSEGKLVEIFRTDIGKFES